jgi:hypothetical protein
MRSVNAVDAVVTWVDGDDPAHRAKLAAYLASVGEAAPPVARATRFHDAGEIEYCIASILRHAPWFRTIHLVTDAQAPALLQKLAGTRYADRVRVVDHREIFAGFEQYLPTFNSRAIISLLWRIEGLSERFVYFNDDFSLLRPVAETDFFRDGKVVLRGTWLPQSRYRLSRRLAALWKSLARRGKADRASNHDAQELSARIGGFDRRYYRMYHNPYPFRRATMRAFFAAHPDLLARNASYRLRSSEQFKGEVLAAHLEIAQGAAILDNSLHTVQLKPRQQAPLRVRTKMAAADRDPHAAFACVQSLELAPAPVRMDIEAWLARRAGGLDALLAETTAP